MTAAPTQHKVAAALKLAGDWVQPDWIAKTAGLRQDQVDSALRRMLAAGLVQKLGVNKQRTFRLAPAGEDRTPPIDFAVWASGAVSITRGHQTIKLSSDEASDLVSFILSPHTRDDDEFTTPSGAARAAVAAGAVA